MCVRKTVNLMCTLTCVCVCVQALWFTEQKGSEGQVFGSNDQWKGLGVFLDSFDNDNQVCLRGGNWGGGSHKI